MSRCRRIVLLIAVRVEWLRFVVLFFKQLFRVLLPCAEMVLVENDKVPVVSVDKFVLCLDAAVLVYAEKVLKRAKADDGPDSVALRRTARRYWVSDGFCLLLMNCQPSKSTWVMRSSSPRSLHGRLEGKYQNLF
jgi:hypothetical protein